MKQILYDMGNFFKTTNQFYDLIIMAFLGWPKILCPQTPYLQYLSTLITCDPVSVVDTVKLWGELQILKRKLASNMLTF